MGDQNVNSNEGESNKNQKRINQGISNENQFMMYKEKYPQLPLLFYTRNQRRNLFLALVVNCLFIFFPVHKYLSSKFTDSRFKFYHKSVLYLIHSMTTNK